MIDTGIDTRSSASTGSGPLASRPAGLGERRRCRRIPVM